MASASKYFEGPDGYFYNVNEFRELGDIHIPKIKQRVSRYMKTSKNYIKRGNINWKSMLKTTKNQRNFTQRKTPHIRLKNIKKITAYNWKSPNSNGLPSASDVSILNNISIPFDRSGFLVDFIYDPDEDVWYSSNDVIIVNGNFLSLTRNQPKKYRKLADESFEELSVSEHENNVVPGAGGNANANAGADGNANANAGAGAGARFTPRPPTGPKPLPGISTQVSSAGAEFLPISLPAAALAARFTPRPPTGPKPSPRISTQVSTAGSPEEEEENTSVAVAVAGAGTGLGTVQYPNRTPSSPLMYQPPPRTGPIYNTAKMVGMRTMRNKRSANIRRRQQLYLPKLNIYNGPNLTYYRNNPALNISRRQKPALVLRTVKNQRNYYMKPTTNKIKNNLKLRGLK
jgi:hypothetical protein